jgi:hypothetical protein
MALIGALTGLDPAMRAGTPEMPGLPLWAAVLVGMLLILIVFPLIVAFLKWWMKRRQRWDGRAICSISSPPPGSSRMRWGRASWPPASRRS